MAREEDGLPHGEPRPVGGSRRRSRAACGRRNVLGVLVDRPAAERHRRRTAASARPAGGPSAHETTPCKPRRRGREPACGFNGGHPSQHLQVAVGHLGQRGRPNRASPRLELCGQVVEHAGSSSGSRTDRPRVSDQLRMPAAPPIRGGQSAGERLEQRVRARIVQARARGRRRGGAARRRAGRTAIGPTVRIRANSPARLPDERQLVALPVEIRGRATAARPHPCSGCPTSSWRSGARRGPRAAHASAVRWKIAGSTALRITTGSRSSSPSSRCFVQAVPRTGRRSRPRARG